jgi:hypothetical protein
MFVARTASNKISTAEYVIRFGYIIQSNVTSAVKLQWLLQKASFKCKQGSKLIQGSSINKPLKFMTPISRLQDNPHFCLQPLLLNSLSI